MKQPSAARRERRAAFSFPPLWSSSSFGIGLAFLVAGCGGPDAEFSAGCDRQGFTGEQCSCLHELVSETAGDEVRELFVAQMLEDSARAQRVRDNLGFLSGAKVLAELGMLLQRAPSACPGT